MCPQPEIASFYLRKYGLLALQDQTILQVDDHAEPVATHAARTRASSKPSFLMRVLPHKPASSHARARASSKARFLYESIGTLSELWAVLRHYPRGQTRWESGQYLLLGSVSGGGAPEAAAGRGLFGTSGDAVDS